jgi:hypothetical protein
LENIFIVGAHLSYIRSSVVIVDAVLFGPLTVEVVQLGQVLTDVAAGLGHIHCVQKTESSGVWRGIDSIDIGLDTDSQRGVEVHGSRGGDLGDGGDCGAALEVRGSDDFFVETGVLVGLVFELVLHHEHIPLCRGGVEDCTLQGSCELGHLSSEVELGEVVERNKELVVKSEVDVSRSIGRGNCASHGDN